MCSQEWTETDRVDAEELSFTFSMKEGISIPQLHSWKSCLKMKNKDFHSVCEAWKQSLVPTNGHDSHEKAKPEGGVAGEGFPHTGWFHKWLRLSDSDLELV